MNEGTFNNNPNKGIIPAGRDLIQLGTLKYPTYSRLREQINNVQKPSNLPKFNFKVVHFILFF